MLVVSARSIRRTVSATVESDAATPARSSPRPKSKAFAARGDSPPASCTSVLSVLSVISPYLARIARESPPDCGAADFGFSGRREPCRFFIHPSAPEAQRATDANDAALHPY